MRATPGLVSLVLAAGALWACLYWWQASRPLILVDALQDHLGCVSYSPFYKKGYTPRDKTLHIPAEWIDADLGLLAKRVDCIRTYTAIQGLDETARLAEKHGLKLIQGIWIGTDSAENERELALGIEAARKHPSAIRAVMVGNEVLLRGEQTPAALRGYLERVRAALPGIPVSYADIWQLWLKYPEMADAVSFATIHILPYWEDSQVTIENAVPYVSQIYQRVREGLPGKEIMIGETGWPSYGRQRQGAVPSLVNQARFIREFEVRAELEKIPYNVIEAFDQDWKRQQEGAVGGTWGLYDRLGRPKFPFRGPVAEAPGWGLLAAGAAAAFFAVFMVLRRRGLGGTDEALLLLAAAIAGGGANVAFWRDICMSSRNWVEWTVTGGYAILLIFATVQLGHLLAAWCATRTAPPRHAPVAALVRWVRRNDQSYDASARLAGLLRFAFLFGAAIVCLGQVFDGYYRDFPVALYAVPAVGLALLSWIDPQRAELEEIVMAGLIALAAPWIAVNEHLLTPAKEPWSWASSVNPQPLGFAGLCLLLAGSVLVPVLLGLRPRQRQCPQ